MVFVEGVKYLLFNILNRFEFVNGAAAFSP